MKPTTIAIVKQTVPLLQQQGTELTQHFYRLLFAENPELKHVFNMASQDNGRQPGTLAAAIVAYASNIDRLEALGPVVDRIAAKHFSLDIAPDQYPIVGRNLLKAIRQILGEEIATDEVIDAWAEAYQQLADILIAVEEKLYQQAEQVKGGWSGFKPFRVARKVQQSSEISSFYLQPMDGHSLPAFKPGQYLSVKVQSEQFEHTEIRQYSLSDAYDQNQYRISVKREVALDEDVPVGKVSNYLHDHVEEGAEVLVHAPGGDFFLKDSEKPLVLISGGVGLTPMVSMLNSLVKQGVEREIIWLHGTRNKHTHAFAEHINMLDRDLPQFTRAVFYEDTTDAIEGEDFNHQGYISIDNLKRYCTQDAEFYYCGPMPFMQSIHRQLKALGITDAQLNYEVFGPDEDLA